MTITRWAIVDTETDGLYWPIHVVEIAAQLMEGWAPVGEPFRVLLNHNVPIPREVVAIHGYTQEYLREHGLDPVEAHRLFRKYVGQVPLVAHNLRFDWDRTLVPEWARLHIQPFAQRGFCSMLLARRTIPETKSHRLALLKQRFGLTQSVSHRALNDVLTVVELFRRVFEPRLRAAHIDNFVKISEFSLRTPITKCWEQILDPQKYMEDLSLFTWRHPKPSVTRAIAGR